MKSRSLWMVMAVRIAVVICGSIWPLSPVPTGGHCNGLPAVCCSPVLFDRLEHIESRLEAIAEGPAAHSPTSPLTVAKRGGGFSWAEGKTAAWFLDGLHHYLHRRVFRPVRSCEVPRGPRRCEDPCGARYCTHAARNRTRRVLRRRRQSREVLECRCSETPPR